MKKLFLSSSFKDVAAMLPAFAGERLEGKTITFIPTASIPEKVNFYVQAGQQALEQLGLIVDELEVSTASYAEIIAKLRENDYIYVTGGNTFYLLQEMYRTGADKLLVEEINRGKLYIGESAGSIILSPNIEYSALMDNVADAPYLGSFEALHAIDFYPVPHYTNIPFKEAAQEIIKQYNHTLKLYPFSNTEVIGVRGDKVELCKV